MDKELARLIVNAANRSQRELADIAPLIKEHCSTEEHGVLSLAIGSAIYEAGLVMERVFELQPGIKDEFKARLDKFGRFC
jgi:hypothetical protein